MSRRINWWGVIFATSIFTGTLLLVCPEPKEKPASAPPSPPPAQPAPVVPAPPAPAWTLAEVRQKARERIRSHLLTAEQQADAALANSLRSLDAFFDDVRQHTRPFAAEVLGFHSKWRCLADYLPLVRGEHPQFPQARFREHLFAPEQLEQVIENVIQTFLAELAAIDGRLLVDVEADLQDLPPVLPVHLVDQPQLQALFRATLDRARQDIASDLQRDLGQAVASTVAGEVLSAVALRLGVSTTVLGAGAASSWFTLGTGFVVGAIIDEILNTVWDWWADPKGQLAVELDHRLRQMQNLLILGGAGQPGRAQLQRLARERLNLRRQTLLELVGPNGEGL